MENIFIINFIFFFIITFAFYFVIYKKNNFFFNFFKNKKCEINIHSKLITQNGGIIVISLFLILFLLCTISNLALFESTGRYFRLTEINRAYLIPISILILLITSMLDYKFKISPAIRLIIHFIVCYISLSLITFPIISIEILPLKVQFFFCLVFWIYVINATNFIDGIDGMLSICIISFMLSIILAFWLAGFKNTKILYFSLILLPLLFSFLIFNFPAAKIFMGDSGSIPLGYLMGYMIINLFIEKEYFLCFVGFLYPLLDVGITIVRKIKNKIYPWARLFDYFFLLPVIKGGLSSVFVLKKVIFLFFITSISNFFIITFKINYIFFIPIIFFLNIYYLYLFNNFREKK